jgi:FMN-dependent oxidoreductase (nitrilotriacetate monooxygenase family)
MQKNRAVALQSYRYQNEENDRQSVAVLGEGMAKRQDKIKIGVLVNGSGIHPAAWRHPDTNTDNNTQIARQVYMAQRAEAACIDFMFLADILAHHALPPDVLCLTEMNIHNLEPITLLSAIAMVTSRIGLVGSASTTFGAPYHVARMFASLDHISGGRAGWNLVTSILDAEGRNFGGSGLPQREERYARAEEFHDVVVGLWDSFADDALVHDKAAGIVFDPTKVRPLNHEGKHFQVRGPLNLSRPPQGRPVIVQAGSSDAGVALAARTADAVFTVANTLNDAQQTYARIKNKAASFGRDPDTITVMPGIQPFVGETASEAQEKFEQLRDLVHPKFALPYLSRVVGAGIDLSKYPLDGPVPELPTAETGAGRQHVVLDIARREGLTLGQLAVRHATGLGNRNMIGTASQIADEMEEVFMERGGDGFIIAVPYQPLGLTDFLDRVVPELQRRGLFRTAYEGTTLRDTLGLARPARAPAP